MAPPDAAPASKMAATAATIMGKASPSAPPGFVAAVDAAGAGASSASGNQPPQQQSMFGTGGAVAVVGAAPGAGVAQGAPASPAQPTAANIFAGLTTQTYGDGAQLDQPGSELATLRALVIQLAARVRTLEHTQYAILMAPSNSRLAPEPGAGLGPSHEGRIENLEGPPPLQDLVVRHFVRVVI